MRRLPLAAVLASAVALACSNAGADKLLSIGGNGVVRGVIFFDMDGNRVISAGDDSVRNLTVRLMTLDGLDTIASGASAVSGQFRIPNVPVGTYRVVLATGPLSDTAVVVAQDSQQVTILPQDSVAVVIGVSYPHISVRAARNPGLFPVGRKVFLEGIALNAPSNFRDTTMHLQDTSGAIRMTRIVATSTGPGDSVRVRGTTSTRTGQRTLDVVTVFPISLSFLPTATTVTTAVAKTASNGALDAQQVLILNAPITDTNPTVNAPDFTVTVNDGSGALEILLDPNAPGFQTNVVRPPNPAATPPYVIPGNKFDIVGLLVPTSTPGVWRLKPRSSAELTQRP